MAPTAHTSTHTIHVLVRPGMHAEGYGVRSLCGSPTGAPSGWPEGHLAVRLGPGGSLPPVVNCPDCIGRHSQLVKGAPG